MIIPRKMHQIWVGPLPQPTRWMESWPEKHPDWLYSVWTNEHLGDLDWINKKHMDRFASIGRWDGVADLMRYEILLGYGGVVVAADSECLLPLDPLFEDEASLYAIATHPPGFPVRRKNRGSMTPLYASTLGHGFPQLLVEELSRLPVLHRKPVRATGNRYMQRMVKAFQPEITVWPMHYFIPRHFNGWRYEGPDPVYAVHHWGTTKGTYSQGV